MEDQSEDVTATERECRGFWWLGQSMDGCDNCGRDIREHDGLHHFVGGPFDQESIVIPFEEAMERFPLWAHYVTPIGKPEGPFRWQRELTDVQRAIAIIEDSRRTHQEWIDYSESGHQTPDEADLVGDIDHHRECIAGYDLVLSVLRSVSQSGRDARAENQP